MPSPGGQASGMAATSAKFRFGWMRRHPVNLPKGYHTVPREQSSTTLLSIASRAAPGAPRGRTPSGRRDATCSQRARSVVAERRHHHDGGRIKIRPSPGRETSSNGKNQWVLMRHVPAAHPLFSGRSQGRPRLGEKITQIYEGTNQIQRVVMARALLNG